MTETLKGMGVIPREEKPELVTQRAPARPAQGRLRSAAARR